MAALTTMAVAMAALLPAGRRGSVHSVGAVHAWVHLTIFFVIGTLAAWSTDSVARRVGFCIALALFGFGTEFAEYWLGHAPLEWTDIVLDAIGDVAGAGVGALTARRRRPYW